MRHAAATLTVLFLLTVANNLNAASAPQPSGPTAAGKTSSGLTHGASARASHDLHHDKRDLHQDRKTVKHDQVQLLHDQQAKNRDRQRLAHDQSASQRAQDERKLNQDRKNLQHDRHTLHHDEHKLHHAKADYARDLQHKRSAAPGSTHSTAGTKRSFGATARPARPAARSMVRPASGRR